MSHETSLEVVLSSRALFVADAHYGAHRQALLPLLDRLLEGKYEVSQLYFMGDMFDLLIGGFSYLERVNHEAIEKINLLATKMEVIYLEGNHDFCVETIFPAVRVIPLSGQPLSVRWGEKRLFLSHGDIFMPLGYRLYTSFIRSKKVLKVLDIVTTNRWNDWFIRWQHDRLIPKNLCHRIDDFQGRSVERLKCYPQADAIVEGHFHQGEIFFVEDTQYIGLPSYACTQEVALCFDGEWNFQRGIV